MQEVTEKAAPESQKPSGKDVKPSFTLDVSEQELLEEFGALSNGAGEYTYGA